MFAVTSFRESREHDLEWFSTQSHPQSLCWLGWLGLQVNSFYDCQWRLALWSTDKRASYFDDRLKDRLGASFDRQASWRSGQNAGWQAKNLCCPIFILLMLILLLLLLPFLFLLSHFLCLLRAYFLLFTRGGRKNKQPVLCVILSCCVRLHC